MDLCVFPQLRCVRNSFEWSKEQFKRPVIKALAEVALALSVNIAIGSSVVSLPPLTLGLAVLGGALIVLRPEKEGYLTDSAHFLARLSLIHVISLATITPIVHESGHALMALLLFKKPNVKIQYNGFFSGANTTYTVSYGLTFFGRFLGKERAIGVIAAGGMVTSTAWAMTCYSLCKYLAISQLFHETTYAVQALRGSWDWSHDYSRLWMEHNIHPLVPITGMVTMLAFKMIV